MQVLRQIPPQIPSPNPQTACGKTIYASEKVREAMRDHEQAIAPSVAPKHKAKIVVLGDSGVGKTSIVYRYKFGAHFAPVNATIGASFVSCDVDTDHQELVRLQVWDTAGQERFRCMVPMYMRNADAALIVYDVTNRESFENVGRWVKDLERSCGTDDTSIYLIGNKTDLADKREVSEAEGKAKAVKINAKFLEVSSDQMDLFSQLLSEVGEDVLCYRQKTTKYIDDVAEKKQKIFLEDDEEDLSFGSEESKNKKFSKFVKSKCCSML